MRIQQLNLMAYGPFTDKVLNFEDAGLHVIYGPNEAGKSSALRALTALLYGIENSTTDNQVHENGSLRIGGSLLNADGHTLDIVRRKGRTKTLLSPDSSPLDEQVLTPYLQGVTRALFQTLFGIDHKALVQGGRDILEQKGDVGQALFSAALGSHLLHDVLTDLDNEAVELFKPRGSTQKINTALKLRAEAVTQLGVSSLKSSTWEQHQKALEESAARLDRVNTELDSSRTQINRLKRIQRVLPYLGERRRLHTELEQLGDIVVLSEDFSKRRQEAEKKLSTAQSLLDSRTPQRERLHSELQTVSVNSELLEQAENIQSLHSRLESYRQGLLERPRLEAEEKQLVTDARAILREVRPDLDWQAVETLRTILSRKAAVNELVKKHPLTLEKLTQTESELNKKRHMLETVRSELGKLKPARSTALLRGQIAASRNLGEIGKALDTTRSELQSLTDQSAAKLSRLNFWQGQLDQVAGLRIPGREAIDQFDDDFKQLGVRKQQCQNYLDENILLLQKTRQDLDEINKAGQVVTEDEMLDIRKERDTLWQLLRRRWVSGEDTQAESARYVDSNTELHEVFENRLTTADDMADRLRRESSRVLKLAALQSTLTAEKEKSEQLSERMDNVVNDEALLVSHWQQLWSDCQIIPGTAREMRSWLDSYESLRADVEQTHSLQHQLNDLDKRNVEHISLLIEQTEALGLSIKRPTELAAMLIASETCADELDAATTKHKEIVQKQDDIEQDINVLDDQRQDTNQTLDSWKLAWSALMQELALPQNLQPVEMDELIDSIRVLFEKLDEAARRQISLASIHESNTAYSDQVQRMVDSVAPEHSSLPPEEAVLKLYTLLSENQSTRTSEHRLQEQIKQIDGDIAESTAVLKSMNLTLETLCQEAKCDDHSKLDELENRSAQYLELKQSITSNEKDITNAGDGNTIKELEIEADSVEVDSLPAAIEQLHNRINDELEPERSVLTERKGREKAEIEKMDGSNSAAELAEKASSILAGIRTDAEEYVRVKLAAKVLREHIERYRQENQGPLIKRASEHFTALTRQSFRGLVTDFNAKDEPVLTGVRDVGSKPVKVEGMSSGTLDQLYLALRLASLEKYAASATPMPFIVDDVLIEFDDDRSLAALQALADMAQTTQVILFTHHSRILEQTGDIKGGVTEHRL